MPLNQVATASGSTLLAHSESNVSFNNTLTETDLANFTLPANTFALGDVFRTYFYGDILHNNVSANTLQFKLYFGSVILTGDANNFNTVVSANRRPWNIQLHVAIVSSTTMHAAAFLLPSADTTNTMGLIGVNSNGMVEVGSANAAATATITSTINVRLTGTWSAASANNEAKLYGYYAEKLAA